MIRHDAGTGAEPYVNWTLLAVRRVMEVTGLIRGLDRLLFGTIPGQVASNADRGGRNSRQDFWKFPGKVPVKFPAIIENPAFFSSFSHRPARPLCLWYHVRSPVGKGS
jgi:hypothetical protein